MTRFVFVVLLLPLAFAPSVLAVTITTPDNHAQVTSPIALVATADSCSSQPVTAMGYSLDSGTDSTLVDKRGLTASIPASAGTHTIHVKAWNAKGAVCVQDVTVDVSSSTTPSDPPVTQASTSSQGITVTSPSNGASLSSPFTLTASASSCQSKAITKTGYSMDNSTSTTMVDSSTIGATVTASTGSHTLHVKAWGTGGVYCTVPVKITVTASSEGTTTSSQGISVTSPENGSSVSSPFSLVASAPTCSGQAVSSLGYSLDNSSHTTLISGTSADTQVTAAAGGHTLHVKSWGKSGAACTNSLSITVSGTSATGDSVSAPSDATAVSSLQALSGWIAVHDTGTNNTSSGSTSVVTSPTLSGHARKFTATWSGSSGERFSLAFGDDRTSENFLYDGWVYIASSSGSIANIEMDLNQTMPSGNTVIFGFQCDGYAGKWDYSMNTGTSTSPIGKWVSTSFACDPANWSRNTWHHVQILYSRATTGGTATFKSVTFDGVTHTINKTVFVARSMGWGSSIVTNFQIDGRGSGSATVYLDKLVVSRW